MQERSATVVGALVLLLVLLPLGVFVHVSPRFPGSLAGSLIGITGAVLMLVAMSYAAVKRIPALHVRVTKRIAPRTLLALHVYAGIAGPILGFIHAAHKFNSPLGISLTGIMILVVLSGYVGRYLLAQMARAVRGRKSELASLRGAFSGLATGSTAVAASPAQASSLSLRAWLRSLFVEAEPAGHPAEASLDPAEVASAIADTEYAIRSEEVVNRLLGRWLTLHTVLAILLLLLLLLHVWSGIYYGLRWL